jgi:2-oxoglutarate ferredoxin oxidoreductase subunit alpha
VHPNGGYFTRGSGHTKHATYTEDAGEYQEVVDRLTKKLDVASYHVPAPSLDLHGERGDTTTIGIISIGGCHGAVAEAVARMRADGVAVDY